MEATVTQDFEARSNDELSVNKGTCVKVLERPCENRKWIRAELDGREGVIPLNHIEIDDIGWFFGKMTYEEADLMAQQREERNFFIRDSDSIPGGFSLSVYTRSNGVLQFDITRDSYGNYIFGVMSFNSLNKLVAFYRESSLSHNEEKVLLQ
ncbi:growth factor receptor-bound protein 2-like [Tubulanus polymorphus]|uniref:growth factor receptor-bound protein 2-like n=1 Tax=Tubulanus polymorphus TaxID=672921 RepID=UPI003DA6B733